MVGGQAIDLQAAAAGRGAARRRRRCERCTRARPARSIRGAAHRRAPSWPARPTTERAAIDAYGEALGLAFQIVDDILDVEGASADSARPPARMRRRQADLPGALRPRRVAPAGARVRRSRAAPRLRGAALAASCRRSCDWVARAHTVEEDSSASTRCSSSAASPRRASARARSILAGQVASTASPSTKAGTRRADADVDARRRPIIRTSAAAASSSPMRSTFGIAVAGRDRARHRRVDRRLHRRAARDGAARVVALDVGHGQLDWRLRNDPRVVVLERVNART